MEENYLLAKQLVNQKFPEGSGIDGFFILGLYGLLSIYSDYRDIVEKVFLDTDIWFESGTIKEILDRNDIDLADYKYDERSEKDDSATYAVSSIGTFVCLEDGKIKIEKHTPYIAASLDHVGVTRLLNSFIHEMGHIIKGYTKGYAHSERNNKIYAFVRTGLHIDGISFNKDDNSYYDYKVGEIIDEVINTVQTTEALQEIKALDGWIPDKEVQDMYNMLNKQILDEDYGYNKSVKAFRPLWECKSFKKLIDENVIPGNLSTIRKYFDRRTFKGAFSQLSDLLDDMDEVECDGGDFIIEFVTNLRIKHIINKYKKNKSKQKKK